MEKTSGTHCNLCSRCLENFLINKSEKKEGEKLLQEGNKEVAGLKISKAKARLSTICNLQNLAQGSDNEFAKHNLQVVSHVKVLCIVRLTS